MAWVRPLTVALMRVSNCIHLDCEPALRVEKSAREVFPQYDDHRASLWPHPEPAGNGQAEEFPDLNQDAAEEPEDRTDDIGGGVGNTTLSELDDQPDNRPRPNTGNVQEMHTVQLFIEALDKATLDTSGLPEHVLKQLRNPPTGIEDYTKDPALAISLETYLHLDYAANTYYNGICQTLMTHYQIEMLTLDQVQRKAEKISGVVPLYTDMCINTCLAFTGPFADLDKCPTCSEPHYERRNGKRTSRKQAVTIPVGPQIQAAWQSPDSAKAMSYRSLCTKKILEGVTKFENINLTAYSDFIHGEQYLKVCLSGEISENDTVLMGSFDGAQLYRMKESDCWIYIWVFLDRAPDNRYKNKHIF